MVSADSLAVAGSPQACWSSLGLVREATQHLLPLASLLLSSAFYFYLVIQGGTDTMVTTHPSLYKEWVPRMGVTGPQGPVEGLRGEPLVSSQEYSGQEWGLKAGPSALP